MKILVTSGATREPLDDVRFLSNVSTGATGAALADALVARGHAVTLLRGTGAVAAKRARSAGEFGSTADLHAKLRALVGAGKFDAVIHCAAVADYTPARVTRGKMSSYAPSLTVRLVPTPKILPLIKSFAPRSTKLPTVIGFKLTSGADATARVAAVAKLFAAGTVDAAIHNDMAELAAGRARPFRAFVAGHARPQKLAGLSALTAWLDSFLKTFRASGP
jgi:phosphopantothenoylcysteine decarboxylase/phosphopantothenate--cysteine ligase